MKTKSLLILFAFCLILVSCDNESLYEEVGNGTLLKQVLIEGEVYSEYAYNSADLIVEEKSKYHYSKHVYNSSNKIVQSDHYWDWRIVSSSSYVLEEASKRTEWVSPDNTEKDSYTTFDYDRNGRLEKSTSNRLNSDYSSYSSFSYNKHGRIERCTSYHEDKASMYDNLFYDSLGNLVKKECFFILENGSVEKMTTTEYKFDNKHNPYLSFRGLLMPGRNTNPNNIIKETYILHGEVDDFIEPVQITEYRYEYNRSRYPTRRNDSFEYVYY